MPKGVYDHKPKPWPARFWKRVRKDVTQVFHHPTLGPCWEWTGAADSFGYGRIWYNGKLELATHIAWLLETGHFPINDALHACDNPSCVRFSHLFDGSAKANSEDMVRKGRQGGSISNVQARAIKDAYASGTNQHQLAAQYGLTQAGIWYTIHRRSTP
jgi:hypothetical protein